MSWALILMASVVVLISLPVVYLLVEVGRKPMAQVVRDRWRLGGLACMILGVALMAFALQTTGDPDPIPAHKFEIAHFIETGLWVNPHILLIGAAVFFVGVPLCTRGLARFFVGVIATLVVVAASAIFVVRPDFIM